MQTKTEKLTIALLERDKRALRRLAEHEGEAMAVVVRKLIRRADSDQAEKRKSKGGN